MEKMLMHAKLISYSQPADTSAPFEHGTDLIDLVAFCARVSNPGNQHNTQTNDKLIRYLINHKHWSPLEMVSACIEIETTRDIARQILRHRSFSFQEFSQRYADPTNDLGIEFKEARLQDTKNRQNSIKTDNEYLNKEWEVLQTDIVLKTNSAYKWAIDRGIAKEQARAVLPEGLTVSRMYMNGTLRSWVHYIELRSGHGTQEEHREVALACAVEIVKIFPMIKDILEVSPDIN
jgi:thymidylate synthase (FAD)